MTSCRQMSPTVVPSGNSRVSSAVCARSRSVANNLIVKLFTDLFAQQISDVAELGNQQLLHREPARGRGAGERGDEFAVTDAGNRTAHHRGGADFLERKHPEQFAEAFELLVQQ